MSLKSRIDRLEQSPMFQPRMVIVSTADDHEEIPGSIEPWENGRGYSMRVPPEYGADPIAGLDDQQRAVIQPGDEVISLTWDDHGDGSATAGVIELRWPD